MRFSFSVGLLLPALFLFLYTSLPAQMQSGMRLERYAGILSTEINPAYTAFNPQGWDLALFSGDLYVHNTYGFIRDASIPDILRDPDRVVSIADTSGERSLPDEALIQDFYNPARPMHLVAQLRAGGPAFSFRIGDNHTFGLVTALRTHAASYRIPEVYRYEVVSDLPFNQAVRLEPVRFAGMAWAEIGAHYNFRNPDGGDLFFTFGVTPKLLLGLEAAFVSVRDNYNYTQLGGNSGIIENAQVRFGIPVVGDTDNYKARIRGKGIGVDLGAAWAMVDGDTEEDYLWRFGVSLLDIGAVQFRKNVEAHSISQDSAITLNSDDFDDTGNTGTLASDLSEAFLGAQDRSFVADRFSVGLPTAFSAQFDYRVVPQFYASAVWIQRLPVWKNPLKRPNMLAVVPRFEHRWFSASLPIVLDDWQALRLGAALRLGVLTLGSDNLGSLWGQKHLNGTDFYVGLKINGFSFGNGSKGSRSGGGNGNRRKIKCYQF